MCAQATHHSALHHISATDDITILKGGYEAYIHCSVRFSRLHYDAELPMSQNRLHYMSIVWQQSVLAFKTVNSAPVPQCCTPVPCFVTSKRCRPRATSIQHCCPSSIFLLPIPYSIFLLPIHYSIFFVAHPLFYIFADPIFYSFPGITPSTLLPIPNSIFLLPIPYSIFLRNHPFYIGAHLF